MRAAPYSDHEYITGVQRGDETVFTSLVHTYLPSLTRFAYGFIGNEEGAHDIVQDVFARVWQLGPDWNPKTSVAAYLFTAIRHRALNAIKSTQASQRMQQSLRIQTEPPMAMAESYPDVALIASIRIASQELTERQQTALRLRFEQGFSTSEVAAVLGIEPKAAEKLFGRAFATLRARLAHLRQELE